MKLLFVSAFLVVLVSCFGSEAFAQKFENSEDASARMGYGYYQQGLKRFEAGDYAGAIPLLKKAVSFGGSNKDAFHILGISEIETGDTYNAMVHLRTALNINYNFVQARNSLGLLYYRTGKINDAQNEFKKCITINPKYPNAYYNLGVILKEKGDLPGAIENFQKAIDLNPKYWEAKQDLGLALFERSNQGDLSEALDKLLEAVALVPNNPMLHYHLGNIYAANGKLDDAEAEFRRTLMIEPRHAAAHYELARVRYYRGDVDRCIGECKEAMKVNPTFTESQKYPPLDPLKVRTLLANAYELKGEKVKAVETLKVLSTMVRDNQSELKHITALEKSLRQEAKKKGKPLPYDQQEIDALINRGIDQTEDGDLDGAKSTFERILELNPQNWIALQNIGAILEAQGDLNGAMAKYQAAMAINPSYDGLYYNLGHLLEKLNLPAEAGMMYERFYEKAGKYPYDPKHVVELQQEDARRKAREYQLKKRGY